MHGSVVRITLSLIGPGILTVFGSAFLAAWFYDKKRRYLRLLAGACWLFTLGGLTQILYWPRDTGLNAMTSGSLYTLAVIAAVEGILERSHRKLGISTDAVILAVFLALLSYFVYVDRSLTARIYIQNFGYGLLLTGAAIRLWALREGQLVDRVLLWTLSLFGLHFFPRTVFTVGLSPPAGELAFADSLFWQTLQLSLAVLGAALAMSILAASISDSLQDVIRERDIDHLTGISNRRGFEAAITPQLHKTRAASLILCDVDHFKSINDEFGHQVGDVVLKAIGFTLRELARKEDPVGRLGGEEFAVFLPGASIQDAYECAERFRQAIAKQSLPELRGKVITASFGVATLREANSKWETLYQLADERLYRAKERGRNRTDPGSPIVPTS